jgi:hypothetical protein
MVIISTKAAEVNIHALSPLSSFGAGVGVAALGVEGVIEGISAAGALPGVGGDS